jgi:hypothetical protein
MRGLRERVALPAGPPRPLRAVQRVLHRPPLPGAGVPSGSGQHAVPLERGRRDVKSPISNLQSHFSTESEKSFGFSRRPVAPSPRLLVGARSLLAPLSSRIARGLVALHAFLCCVREGEPFDWPDSLGSTRCTRSPQVAALAHHGPLACPERSRGAHHRSLRSLMAGRLAGAARGDPRPPPLPRSAFRVPSSASAARGTLAPQKFAFEMTT